MVPLYNCHQKCCRAKKSGNNISKCRFRFRYFISQLSEKRKRHINIKQIFPVTARAAGGLPTGWGGVFRPLARGRKFMCCVRNPRNINVFVRAPGREESGSRPGGSVTGVTEKLFMCQMFMCLFRPLIYLKVAVSISQTTIARFILSYRKMFVGIDIKSYCYRFQRKIWN